MRTVTSRSICSACMTAAVIALAAIASCTQAPKSAAPRLNREGVVLLLNVMDVMAQTYPGFEDITDTLRELPEAEVNVRIAAARQRNAQSPELTAAIDALIESEPYRLYFRRFRNVTPAIMRDLLLDLPYRRQSGPGGIGEMLYDLLRERKTVRTALDRFVDHADMGHVLALAARWAPEGSQAPSRQFLFYDSNAGSFTAEGVPFFNLCGDVDLAKLSSDPTDSTLDEAVGVMAHELQHTLAAPFLYPDSRSDSPWQVVRIDRITRGLVSEGVANHCNPPSGLKKELYEDSAVVSALMKRLNDVVLALGQEQMTEEEMQAWYRDNYFAYAEGLLRQFLERRFSGDELEKQVRVHASLRPDLEHALGWWMVSRVSDEGRSREIAVSLVTDPYGLYRLYDQAVGDREDGFRLGPEAMQILAAVREQAG